MELTIRENQARNEKTKQWLWRYRKAKIDSLCLENEYRELVSIQESAGSVSYDGVCVSGTNTADLSNLMIARENVLTRLIRSKKAMSDSCAEIIAAANSLEPAERDIVVLRYIQLKDGFRINSMYDIAKLVGYSTPQVKRIHGKALQHIGKMIPNDTI